MFDEETRVARATFDGVRLGDRRLEARLIDLAAQSFRAPRGTITSVFSSPAQREAAYRFVENPRVRSEAIRDGVAASTARLAAREDVLLVPVDGSSLTLVDRKQRRDVGIVGAFKAGARGLIVVTALAVSAAGTPLGVLGQHWWSRHPSQPSVRNELRNTLDVIDEVTAITKQLAPKTRLWFQMDRLYDAQVVLEQLAHGEAWFTARTSRSRRLHEPPTRYTDEVIAKARPLGTHTIEVPRGRKARSVTLAVRVCTTIVSLKRKSKTRHPVRLTYVDARERAKGGLRWTLITNRPVESLAAAIEVINAYTTRWRIEEFHRAWKAGVCRVEDTQLRAREAIIKWATMLAAVAARATRLAYLAREKPDLPASEEFDATEIQAALLLAHGSGLRVPEMTLTGIVDLIAKLGGYTGKSSGGPPGATTLSRGLVRVRDAATILRAVANSPPAVRRPSKK